MSADGDFVRSVQFVSEVLIKRLEDNETSLSEMPDLFKKAGEWLVIQNERRIEWLWGSEPRPDLEEEMRMQIESDLAEAIGLTGI